MVMKMNSMCSREPNCFWKEKHKIQNFTFKDENKYKK